MGGAVRPLKGDEHRSPGVGGRADDGGDLCPGRQGLTHGIPGAALVEEKYRTWLSDERLSASGLLFVTREASASASATGASRRHGSGGVGFLSGSCGQSVRTAMRAPCVQSSRSFTQRAAGPRSCAREGGSACRRCGVHSTRCVSRPHDWHCACVSAPAGVRPPRRLRPFGPASRLCPRRSW